MTGSNLPTLLYSSLNEKRRVDRRKRPNEGTQLLYSIASPTQKKFKLHGGEVIELKEDAIIVNGSIKGLKLAAEGHAPQDIAVDLQDCLRESAYETERLLSTANSNPEPILGDMQAMYERAFTAMNRAIFLMTQWKASWDVVSAAAAAAAGGDVTNGHTTMVSLLLAADKDQQRDEPTDPESLAAHHHHHHHHPDHDVPHPDEVIKKEDHDEVVDDVDEDHHHHHHGVDVHDPHVPHDSEVPTFEL